MGHATPRGSHPTQTTNAPRVVWGLYRRSFREYEPAWAPAHRVMVDLLVAQIVLPEGRRWVLIGDGIGEWRPNGRRRA